jgi:hypothetical protein
MTMALKGGGIRGVGLRPHPPGIRSSDDGQHHFGGVSLFGHPADPVLALRRLFYRGKTMTRSGTWGCGFTQPTAKMQYTGSSYAASILEFFRPAAPLEEDHPPIKGRFPADPLSQPGP